MVMKRCPKCSCIAELRGYEFSEIQNQYYVTCRVCGYHTCNYDTPEKAINIWNSFIRKEDRRRE